MVEKGHVMMLMLLFQIGSAIFNAVDFGSDIWVALEYSKKSELYSAYVGSLVIIGINTLFVIFLGIYVELGEKEPRYSSSKAVNTFCSVTISLLQLRVYVETYYVIFSYFSKHEGERNSVSTLPLSPELDSQSDRVQPSMAEFERRCQIRAAVALMQSVFYSAPQLLLQTWVIMEYNQTNSINVFSVILSTTSLAGSMALYSCKEDHLDIKGIAALFLLAQLSLRVMSIVFVSVSYRIYALFYVGFAWVTAVVWSAVLGLASKSSNPKERYVVALIISPMFLLFTVDTSGHELDQGSAKCSYANRKMIPFVVWRLFDCLIGVFVACYAPLYKDDAQDPVNILSPASVATALYIVSYIILYELAPETRKLELNEDTMMMSSIQ